MKKFKQILSTDVFLRRDDNIEALSHWDRAGAVNRQPTHQPGYHRNKEEQQMAGNFIYGQVKDADERSRSHLLKGAQCRSPCLTDRRRATPLAAHLRY